ncbi:MAG: pseudouridine synthase [Candidatus Omnitrophota bacterium]|nr:pseudouridine synthase [Candidatus Omnitrophota bacterium]
MCSFKFMVHRSSGGNNTKRLQTILARAGLSSRRGAVQFIEDGRVKVDGRTLTEKGARIDPDKHEIRVDGHPLSKEKKFYFLFNKPKNVISTVRDTHGRKKVTDYFKVLKARLYPVGRLDKDTTGILIITNDGALTHRLSHPGFEIEKEYEVKAEPGVRQSDILKIKRGIELDGKMTAPCEIRRLGKSGGGAVYRIKLHEGRKRQIRRMFEMVGSRVTSLKRVKYGGLTLGRLKEGEFRELTSREIQRLKSLEPNS